MTDEQIINNLKCCVKLISDCSQCSYRFNEDIEFDCEEVLVQDTLDLINRQKVEIERLEKELHLAKVEISKHFDYSDGAANEAIKEFAALLKGYLRLNLPERTSVVTADDIDKLVKEMTEVQE